MAQLTNIHGRFIPGNIAARAMSISSKKKQPNQKIQLDKLFPLEKPVICIKRRLGGIGDVIMTTPLCAAIKRLLPHCTLIYATDTDYASGGLKEIIEHCPYVDKIIPNKEIREEDYHYSVDITSTGLIYEKAKAIPPNRIDMFADEAGVSIADNPVPCYEILQSERDKATKEIDSYLTKPRKDTNIIAIQTRSNDPRRTWPLDRVEELIKKLGEDDSFLILILDWGKTTSQWPPMATKNIIPILDRSITDTAALLEQSDVVVAPDSSILHLAGALGKKIVSIFGPVSPESRINHYINAMAITIDLPCRPCWYTPGCIRKVGREGPQKFECLTRITVDMVQEAILKKLKEEEKPAQSIVYGKDISVAGQDNVILVKRSTRGIGDILMALNGVEALKAKYPNKEIHLAVQKDLHEILSYNPKIDKLVDVSKPINQRNYFMVIDISIPCARYESDRVARRKPVQKGRVEIFSEAMGTRNFVTDLLPRYYISDEEFEDAQIFFKNKIKNKKPVLFFAPASAEIYRDYPQQHWQPLIDKLYVDFNIILSLPPNKTQKLKKVKDISTMSFREKMAILGLCDGCITTDSAPLHVAAALKIPCIALFGPIDFRARCYGYKNTIVLRSDLNCIPCWRNSTTKCKQKTNEIPKVYSKCMENILPYKVARIVQERFLNASI